jgi:hypothetical protein
MALPNNHLAIVANSNSTFDLSLCLSHANQMLDTTLVREEVNAISMAPLAALRLPRSIVNGGTSIRSTARTKVPPRRTTPPQLALESNKSRGTQTTSSGNTVYTSSYTVVGIRKLDGGYGKGVMRRMDKGKEPSLPM